MVEDAVCSSKKITFKGLMLFMSICAIIVSIITLCPMYFALTNPEFLDRVNGYPLYHLCLLSVIVSGMVAFTLFIFAFSTKDWLLYT